MKNFCCSAENCKKRYRLKGDLKRHTSSHTQTKPSESSRSPSPLSTSAVTSSSVPAPPTAPFSMAAVNLTMSDGASEPQTGQVKRRYSEVVSQALAGATNNATNNPNNMTSDKVLSPTTAACTDRLVLSQTVAAWIHVGQHSLDDVDQMDPVNLLAQEDYWAAVRDQKYIDEKKATLSDPYCTPRITADHALSHGCSASVSGIMGLKMDLFRLHNYFLSENMYCESVLRKMRIIANNTQC